MTWFAKPPQRLTGVGRILSASHRDQQTMQVHGHTWEITAWFTYDGTDAGVRRYQLDEAIGHFDHKVLPDRLAWGEALAEHIAAAINGEYERGQNPCVEVEVSRPLERIYAKWRGQ